MMKWMPMAMMLAAFGCAAEEAPKAGPVQWPELDVFHLDRAYYDPEGGAGLWGEASHGLGFLFRQENGKPVCHLLFFGEGRQIVKDVVEPVQLVGIPAREQSTFPPRRMGCRIGKIRCMNPSPGAFVVEKDGKEHRIPSDTEGVVPLSCRETAACRYLVMEYLTAADLAAAEAKATPKTVEEAWAKLKGKDYVDPAGAGIGLRFHEKDGKRLCRVVTFGSGRPVVGDRVETVELKGTESIQIGEQVYRLDPSCMSLSRPDGGRFFPGGSDQIDCLLKVAQKEKGLVAPEHRP